MGRETKKFVVHVSFTAHVEATSDTEAFHAASYKFPADDGVKNLQMRVVAAIPLKQEQPAPDPDPSPVFPVLELAPCAPEAEELRQAAPDSDIPF